MAKLTKKEVMAAHDRWARDMQLYGDNNLATARSACVYSAQRDQWEAENGKGLFDKPRRSGGR